MSMCPPSRPGRPARSGSRRVQTGFGMIEVLIAVFVLTIGMLGVAALQTQGLRAGQTASYRTMAVIKAREIVERMRSNADSVQLYAVQSDGNGINNGCDDTPGGVAARPCNPAEMTQHDIFRWKESLADAMPDGNGSIVVNPGTSPPTVTVTVTWTERDANLTYTTETQI